MPKLILRCNYLKHAPAAHLQNYVKYIATREGVEKTENSMPQLPATVNQKALIQDILSKIEDASKLHEYYDYLQKPTRENASEFITQALENNLDIITKKKNFMDYLANRPGVEKIGTHGLFSNEGEAVVLSRVADEVAKHQGVIWTNVVSLRREDAERLGYNSAAQWKELVRSRIQTFAENYKIDSRNLKWYAAFHNESHHPHIHLVIYSTHSSEGYLSRTGIENIRSALAHDIFRQDFMSIYEQKTEQRNQLKEQAEHSLLFLLEQMQNGVCRNEIIMEQMELLSNRLQNTGGKKVYGYLKADIKAIVNRIVDELAKEPLVKECYERWLTSTEDVLRIYKDRMPERLSLSMQKELKSIKNMVIAEAVKLGSGHFWFDDERSFIADAEQHNLYDELPNGIEQQNEGQLENLQSQEIQEGSKTQEYVVGHGNHQANNLSSTGGEDATAYSTAYEDNEAMLTQGSYYADWTERYKEAREYLYGTENTEPDFEAAYEIMMEEAMNENALALFDIGRMYQKGIGVEHSQEQAEEWYQRALTAFEAVESKKAKAYIEYRIGKQHQYGLGTEKNSRKAAEWYEKSIARSQYLRKSSSLPYYALGTLYYQGEGVEQSYEKARHLFMEAHTRGNVYASFELAKMYERGIGIEKDLELAENCYQMAFLGFLRMEQKSKDDNLFYRIGCMYLDGKGTEPDERKAEQYLRKAVEYGNLYAKYRLAKLIIRQESQKHEGDAEYVPAYERVKEAVEDLKIFACEGTPYAAYSIGKLYDEGELLPKDMVAAIRYLTIAADKNHSYAQYRLGKIYLLEEYKDVRKASRYLEKSAEQGNELAAYQLGKLFLVGDQIEKNVEKAIVYLSQAAEAGNQFAQYALGKIFLIGKEVTQDREKAFDFFSRSAEQGNIYAQYFIDHWNDVVQPDRFLMATRLLHHLSRIFEENLSGRKGGNGLTESKLRRKIRSKKLAQGHAWDDHESTQTQQMHY